MPFITTSDQRWHKLLDNTAHDLYHLPGFAMLEASLIGGEALAWYYEADGIYLLIPLIRRTIDSRKDYHDLVSPYGYPGVLTSRPLDKNLAASLLQQFHHEALALDYVSSFIRLNPLLNNWQLPVSDIWRQWQHGGTVSVNLDKLPTPVHKAYSKNHRRNLQRLTNLDFYATINDWEQIDAYREAYYATMNRRQASAYYFFPRIYFEQLHELIGNRLILISIHEPNGEFAAGGIFTFFGQVMQYHLGATAGDYVALSPSKLMMHEAIEYGISSRATTLHLGGGLGGSTTDGLFRFKHGFGRQYHPYSSLRFTHNQQKYDELSRQRAGKTKITGYFPEYRYTPAKP